MHRSFDAGSIALGGLTALAWVALEDDPGSGYTGCISQGRVRQPERQCCEGLRCNDAVNDFRREKPMTTIPQEQQAMQDEAFRAELRAWLTAHVTDAFREQRTMTFQEKMAVRRAWQKTLFESGWIGIGWPMEYGGRGATLTQESIYHEEMARARAPLAANVIGLNMAGPTLLAVGTPEQKARYLPKILSAEEIWCQGFSEPNAGSDVASLQTRAGREGDPFVGHGPKVWTSYRYVGDFCIFLVRTDFEVPKHKGLSYLIVDMKSPGVSTKPLVQMTGEAEFAELFFENVRVPVENLVGELNKGW